MNKKVYILIFWWFICIKKFDSNIIKIDKKSYKNIFNYYIGYVTIKDSKCLEVSSVNLLWLIFNKVNGYFEEINGNKYLTLVLTNETKENKKIERTVE